MRVGSHYSVISGVHLSYSTNSTAGSSWAQLNWTTAVGRVFTADFSQLPRPAARSHSGRPSPVDIVARRTGCYSVLRDELAWSPQTSDSCALLRLLLRHVITRPHREQFWIRAIATDVARSMVCVSVGRTSEFCQNAEQIEMPSAGRLPWAQGTV